MEENFLFTLLLLCATSSSAQAWGPLFNDKSLKGWKELNGRTEYKIVDGAIVGISEVGTPNTFLATTKNHGNFILEFDLKTDDGLNSEVQLRGENKKDYQNGRVHSYQFEVDPSKRAWSGSIYDEACGNRLYPLTLNPAAKTALKDNAWNRAGTEAIGDSIHAWINGVPCANVWDDMTPGGFIALQVHVIDDTSKEGKTVSQKNIRICTADIERYQTPETEEAPERNMTTNTISPREAKEDWALLWDGETSNGRRGAKLNVFPEKGWKMEDRTLKVMKSGGVGLANGGDIVTTHKYKNFIPTVDFKITEGANSEVRHFVNPDLNKGGGSAIGHEFQILDDDRHPDAKFGAKGNRKLGSLYNLIPVPEKKPFNKKDFNTATIIVQDNHIEHWLNGVKLIEYTRNTDMRSTLVAYSKCKNWPNSDNSAEGSILLQNHGDEVQFRNVKIKGLK